MDAVVVDSSVAIKWFVVEPYSAEARRLLNGYQNGVLTLFAPDLINAEIGNIVWKKHTLQGLAAADARAIIAAFQQVTFLHTSSASLLNQAYQLAVTYRRTVYDMLYVALSLREQCPFVTADERLVNAIRHDFPNVVWIVQWP
jgi:predicted nucleic acid-binding protein